MSTYTTIAENPNSTVVAEYIPEPREAGSYQSENELEQALIRQLQAGGYEYVRIKNNADLLQNVRVQLSRLFSTDFSTF